MRWAAAILCWAAISACAQSRVGEVTTDDPIGDGSLRTVATSGGAVVMSGAAVSAAGRAATLRLDRSGSVHICPRTTVTASASPSGRELMLAVNSGTLELDYQLESAADSLITPDLRLSISGPAAVHVAVDVLHSGDVCVASLDRNNAVVVVTELAGEGSYQVRPGQQVTFINGSTANARTEPGVNCGCPPGLPVHRAANQAPPPSPGTPAQSAAAATSDNRALLAELPQSPAVAQTSSSPPQDSGIPTHTVVEMDAPMIYNGENPEPPSETVAQLKLFRSADDVLLFPPMALPAQMAPAVAVQDAPKPEKTAAVSAQEHGIFHRLGTFLASLFR